MESGSPSIWGSTSSTLLSGQDSGTRFPPKGRRLILEHLAGEITAIVWVFGDFWTYLTNLAFRHAIWLIQPFLTMLRKLPKLFARGATSSLATAVRMPSGKARCGRRTKLAFCNT